ncbi:MAG: MCE family protein [candidate division Zixibacteria bacterium]|nr:MCE family protein [candidate division Zixibacteria bacterium]
MKRSIKVPWGELKVGIVIAIAIVTLLWASFTGGGTSIFEVKTGYVTYVSNANGLVAGAPVWLAGVEVGNVKSIEFVNLDSARRIELRFTVKKSLQHMVTQDAGVKLGTIGLMGDKYLEVVPGSLDLPLIEPDGYVPNIPAGDLSSVFAEGEQTMVSARGMVENLTDLTGRMRAGEGTVGQLFTNDTLFHEMTTLLASLTLLIDDLQKNQERITQSIESVSGNLSEITTRVNSNTGTLGKLISDPGVYNNIHSSTGRIDSILAKVNRGDGTAGALVNDAELYDEVRNLIVRIENLVADIEKNPRKYFKFSVF